MKFSLIAIFAAILAVASAEEALKQRCPRDNNCFRPAKPRQDCQNLGPCECPKGYVLIGSATGFTTPGVTTQTWQCVKYSKNCDIECGSASTGFLGFCLSDTVIEREECHYPDCIFEDKDIFVDAPSSAQLNIGNNGFFVIQTSSDILNSNCNLCKCGEPVCLKRIPYFEYTSGILSKK